MGSRKKEDHSFEIIAAVFIIIILLIIFLVTFGKIDGDDLKPPEEFKEDKEKAKKRNVKLRALIEKKWELQKKLDRKFRYIFFFVRVGLLSIWAAVIYGFYYLGLIQNLGDFLNYSHASILALVTLNFLTFGTLTNLNNYLDLIKMRTRNWVYGKYVNLKESIDENQEEANQLTAQIASSKETQSQMTFSHKEIKETNE